MLLASLTALAAGGCRRDINLLGPRFDAGDGGVADIGVNPACTGLGAPITLPTAAGPTCAAALEARGHRFALCSCESLSAPARIRSDSFDSRVTPTFEETGAAIGIGGSLTATAEVRAGGALYVAGAGGIDVSNQLRTAASMRVGGPLTIRDDNADVGTDAYVNGNVTATGSGRVRVTGTLRVPAGAVLTGVEAGATVNETVTVPPPCDCGAAFVDIAGAIAAATAGHADAAIGLQPTALASVTAPTAIDLPCGTFYLDDIDADAAVTVRVSGRTLLAIGGDVTLRASFAVELDPSAELDLLVGGRLTISGGGTFGATAAPARFRVWVAGPSSVTFDGAPVVNAVIRAPLAPVSAPIGLTLSGSLLARAIMIGADSMLHFDRAVLAAGSVCGEPAAAPVP